VHLRDGVLPVVVRVVGHSVPFYGENEGPQRCKADIYLPRVLQLEGENEISIKALSSSMN
jgi:hypothetical protein